MNTINPRKEVVFHLNNFFSNKSYLNIISQNVHNNNKFTNQNKGFITESLNNVVKNYLKLDWILESLIDRPLKKVENTILNCLRLGIYELDYTDSPEHVILNEIVELAKTLKNKSAGNFVNAVLRNFTRKKTTIKFPVKSDDLSKFLSINYSYPIWLTDKFINTFGDTNAEFLCKWGNSKPEKVIRLNPLKKDSNNFVDFLIKENLLINKHGIFTDFLYVSSISYLINSEWFKNGYFTIQSISSGIPSIVLDPQKDETILDICASPGGKMTHLYELSNTGSIIFGFDNKENRVKLLNKLVTKHNYSNITIGLKDAAVEELPMADKILLDVPCSGFGSLNHKPDIKYNKNPSDLKELAILQYKLINNASKYVKIGGTIVYSTCTIFNEENELIVNKFLENNTNFKPEPIGNIPSNLINKKTGFVNTFPFSHELDGSFIAKIKRIS